MYTDRIKKAIYRVMNLVLTTLTATYIKITSDHMFMESTATRLKLVAYDGSTGRDLEIGDELYMNDGLSVHSALTSHSNGYIKIGSSSHALMIPSLTTTQRNALTPGDGDIIFNSTTDTPQAYWNSVWYNIAVLNKTQTFTEEHTHEKSLILYPTVQDESCIKMMRNASDGGSIMAFDSEGDMIIGANSYVSGGAWNRYRISLDAMLMEISPSLSKWRLLWADSGANPISWSERFVIDKWGAIQKCSDIWITGYLKIATLKALDINGSALRLCGDETTIASKLISLTTTERDALTPQAGMEIYNETLSNFQDYITSWSTRAYLNKSQSWSHTNTFNGASIFNGTGYFGANLQLQTTEAANTDRDTTPSVLGINSMLLTNSGATTITNFDLGVEAQVIYLRFADANTTITDGTNIELSGGANKNFGAGDMCVLVSRSSVWYQVGGVI